MSINQQPEEIPLLYNESNPWPSFRIGTSKKKKRGIANWIREHKAWTAIIGTFFVLVILGSVILGVGLEMSKMERIVPIGPSKIEISNLCSPSLHFKISSQLNNPCKINVDTKESTLKLKMKDTGALIASTSIPPLHFTHGTMNLDVQSTLNIEDEQEVERALQQVKQNQSFTVIAEAHITLKFFGVPITFTKTHEIPVEPQMSSLSDLMKLNTIQFQQSDSSLLINVNTTMNVTSPNTILLVQLPNLSLDILHNEMTAGLLNTNRTEISEESAILPITIQLDQSNVVPLQQMVEQVTKGDPVSVEIRASRDRYQDCFLQRVLKVVDTTIDIDPSSFSSSNLGDVAPYIEIVEVKDQMNMRVHFDFDNVTLEGNLGDIEFDLVDSSNTKLISLTATAVFTNTSQDIELVLSIPVPEVTAERATQFINGEQLNLELRACSQSDNLINQIISAMRLDFTINIHEMGDIDSWISKATFLGSDKLIRDILTSVTCKLSTPLKGRIPALFTKVISNDYNLVTIRVGPIDFVPYKSELDVLVTAIVDNETRTVSIIQDALKHNELQVTITGESSAILFPNLFQKVLDHMNVKRTVSLPSKIPIPWSLDVLKSSTDLIDVQLNALIESPFTFPVILGSPRIIVRSCKYAIGTLSIELQTIYPGSNNFTAIVHADANGPVRAPLEHAVSAFLFGGKSGSLDIGVFSSDYQFPMIFRYHYDFPLQHANDSYFLKCIDLTSFHVNVMDVLKLRCSVDAVVTIWTRNPFPLPITLASVDSELYFHNPHGFGCTPLGCIYSPKETYPLGHVVDPGPNSPPSNGLPLVLPGNSTGNTDIWFNAVSNERCLRLASEYEHKLLVLDMRDTKSLITVGQFQLNVTFDIVDYELDLKAKPCKDRM